HTYADDGTFPLSVLITDIEGGTAVAHSTAVASTAVAVVDAPISATASAATIDVAPGAALSQLLATLTDENHAATAADFTATINWGDGTGASPDVTVGTVTGAAAGGFDVLGSQHSYAQVGTFTLTTAVADKDGSSSTAETTVIVDNPITASGDNLSVLEASSVTGRAPVAGVVSASGGNGQPFKFSVVSGPSHGALESNPDASLIAANGAFTYQPADDFSGTDQFVFMATDGLLTTQGIVTITVKPVNQPPSFTAGANQTLDEAAASVQKSVSRWATDIVDGTGDSANNQLNFVVTNDNNSLFTPQGQPSIDTSGNLTYTVAAGVFGVAHVRVELNDDGSTANGGQTTSAAQMFTITVDFVNQPPTFTAGPD
ncbi:MAG: Ig-like domain-containing protein, partial [Pirellulales bacterium]